MVIRKFKFTFTTQKFINLMKFLKDRTTIKKSLSMFFKIFFYRYFKLILFNNSSLIIQ